MVRVKDPLNNIITLTKECWTEHILKEHPEMELFYNELRNTITELWTFSHKAQKIGQKRAKNYCGF